MTKKHKKASALKVCFGVGEESNSNIDSKNIFTDKIFSKGSAFKVCFGVGEESDGAPRSRLIYPFSRFSICWMILNISLLFYIAIVTPAGDDVTCVYDDVTYVYDDVTCADAAHCVQ